MARRSSSSIPPALAPLAIATASLAMTSTACVHARGAPPVRPAQSPSSDVPPEPLLFAPPFALATPEDAVVRVVGPQRICTGTLIEDDLVLTAHHCVVKLDARGAFTNDVVDPDELQIELGGDYLAWGTVKTRAIVAPPCGASGGAGDVAVLVLERKLVGMSTMTARLDGPPKLGEEIDPIGFGRCALSDDGIHRAWRAGGPVRATTLETFVMSASICPGDSGGPVVARGSHEVVGVISQSAMDGDASTRNVTILARLDAFRRMFDVARHVADGADAAEQPPITCGAE
jgi:V8-like Glu-specific endopeptidase